MRASPRLLFCLAALAACLAQAAVAHADEVRDHRGFERTDNRPAGGYRRRPGPRFMLPLKIDIGPAFGSSTRGSTSGVAAAVGVHWASLSPEPTDLDVGVGVFGAALGAPHDAAAMNDTVAYGGAYLEVGHTLSHGDFFRTWAAGRGEYVSSSAFGQDHVGFGAAGRLSAELYLSGVGIEPGGLFLGTYALGVYVEAGVRDLAGDAGRFGMSAGLTIRTPLVFAP
jgi:hypothetical protein